MVAQVVHADPRVRADGYPAAISRGVTFDEMPGDNAANDYALTPEVFILDDYHQVF